MNASRAILARATKADLFPGSSAMKNSKFNDARIGFVLKKAK
jgi:hypothetical protein